MRPWPWTARAALAAALSVPCCLLAVPAASARPAAPARPAAHAAPATPAHAAAVGNGLRLAAAGRAPVVTDSGGLRSKQGLAAPALSRSMALANAVKQAQARAVVRARAAAMAAAGPGRKCTTAACRARMPTARNLPGSQQAQVRNYWCGPATVSEMLTQLGVRVSQRAAARQLGTTGGGTDWSDAAGYPVPRVLNAHQKRNAYVAVALPWSPTAKQTRTYEIDLVTDISRGAPLAGNAYEVAGGPHLAGNPPNQTIFHWFDIRGYSRSGAITNYEDSVHGASSIGWSTGVPAYSALPSPTIAAILGARGYDW